MKTSCANSIKSRPNHFLAAHGGFVTNKNKFILMKNIIIKFCLVAATISSLSACTKWLEVQPEDRFTEDQIFSNAQGFEDALNGTYITLSSQNLYGNNLTLSVLDLLAQRYQLSTGTTFREIGTYNYTDESVMKRLDGIWGSAYVSIANINRLLTNVDKFSENISPERAKIIKGEALGLRAFLHFDLLRMYGPVYNSVDSTKKSIPYYTALTPNIGGFEPANVVMDKILDDLKQAEALLANDPVKTDGGTANLNSYRFNFYAVKALQARVLLWRNDTKGALTAAKTVIDASGLFPWVLPANIIGDYQSPDRIFSTELLFGTFSKDLYANYFDLFYYELQPNTILATGSATFIDQIYEGNSNDYRKDYIWKVPPLGVSFPAFFKYADAVDKKKAFRNTIPLMRLSEMYYIAAETETNSTLALGYLNTVRNHRGIPSLVNPTSLSDEIMKEYRKEFWGEGQLWFFYKRRKITNVVSPNNSSNITIPTTAFTFPIPQEELSNR